MRIIKKERKNWIQKRIARDSFAYFEDDFFFIINNLCLTESKGMFYYTIVFFFNPPNVIKYINSAMFTIQLLFLRL